jgi:hypothetical protein
MAMRFKKLPEKPLEEELVMKRDRRPSEPQLMMLSA